MSSSGTYTRITIFWIYAFFSLTFISISAGQECSADSCSSGATCEVDRESGVILCRCPPGFSGPRCTILCEENPCVNGGSCMPEGSTFSCSCSNGFGGFYCEQVAPNTPPFFNDSNTIDTVREDTLPGALLHTFSAADSDGDVILFFLGEFNGREHFSIGSESGRLILEKELDREEREVYNIIIGIRDEINQTAEIRELLLVEDVNDNAPVFTTSYSASIQENSPTGVELLRVTADDADKGINQIVVFSIQSVGSNTGQTVPSDLFAISSSGRLTVQNVLDFEVAQQYFITVVAKDSGTPPLNSTTIVTVNVVDIQDSLPAFRNTSYDVSIPESTPVNSLILTISAFDQDVGNPNGIQYTITSGNDEGYFVLILPTGSLYLLKKLDRENQRQPDSFTLTVRASEVSNIQSFSDTTFTITILDIVDESPYFDNPISYLIVPEGEPRGTILSPSLTVYDGEVDARTTLQIRLINPDNFPFELTVGILSNGESTSLRTTDVLDYEETKVYILTVNVSKSNAQTNQVFVATAMVIVAVTDINDNRPIFPQRVYEVPLLEGLPPGADVLQLEVMDADSDPFNEVVYQFTASPSSQAYLEFFNINATTGLITTTVAFDFESHPHTMDLYVTVSNVQPYVGVPPSMDSALIRILLQDTNDSPPVFSQSSYSTCVPENAGPLSVLNLTASDVDMGDNGLIAFYIISDNAFGFEIDKDTGRITLGASLDREVEKYHNLTILARDAGEPPMSTTVPVSICVTDVNDNKPQWVSRFQTFVLSEDASPGPIGAVTAFDLDEGRNADLTYQIVPSNPNFMIDQETGEISLVGRLDRESADVVNITVEVRDGGTPQLTSDLPAFVSITVLDVNDNDPVFTSSSYEFYINENYTPIVLANVGMVTATDADSTVVSSYEFVNPADFEGFTINPTSGTLLTDQAFDREIKAVYEGLVRAVDGEREALTSVRITIRDENDNYPVFDEESYISIVTEGEVASAFLNVTATDIDEGGNGTVTYTFKSGGQIESTFFLNPRTGELSTTASLDRELQASYELTVVARDNPEYGSAKEDEVTVIVVVQDINDNPPTFDEGLFFIEVSEDVNGTADLITVVASDLDEGMNAFISYRITQGNEGNLFTVDNRTGVIRVAQPLDRETASSHTLVVEAYNPSVTNSSTDIASVLVTVLDVNDETPDFSQNIYSRPDLSETSVSGSPVLTVMAMDPDEGPGGEVAYGIEDGNSEEFFVINEETGLITTKGFLPQVENSMTFNLSVSATDGAPPHHVSFATALITIVHSSEVTPIFLQEIYVVNITENLPANTSVVQVEADVNGREDALRYSLDLFNPAASTYFRIDETTGLIVTKRPLDREDVSFLAVTVNARNGDSAFGSATVWISVLDVNDNQPIFENVVSDLVILEDLPAGVLVTEIRSFDDDLGSNALVSYEIVAGNVGDAFTLSNPDNDTWTIMTAQPLDREAVASYQLMVQATDGGEPPLSSLLEVEVSVGDVNDNPQIFPHAVYNGSVAEERFSSEPILILSLLDADLEATNDYSFSLTFGNEDSKFSISEDGELIQTNLLDREEKDVYRLGIAVTDSSFNSSYEATAEILVTVTDVNDNRPVFVPSSYAVNITEGALPSPIVTVSAQDADVGANGEITFNLTRTFSDLFHIDPVQGTISTTEVLDRESNAEYSLVVTATDNAIDPDERLTGSATVTVVIQDVNDSPPVFSEDYLGPFEVMEGSSGYYILSLEAVDPDDISTVITYNLSGLNTEYFDLDSQTGVLTTKTNSQLDYETFQELNITVVAADQDNLQSSVTVGIVIVNINDNSPSFVGTPYNITLSENSTVGSVKFVVFASDADLGPEGEVTYTIQSGNEEETFWIEPESGLIYLNKTLDRETTPGYKLVIRASDNPQEALDVRSVTTTLSITISDLDDSAPVFMTSIFSGVLPESAPGGSVVTTSPLIMAVDADSDSQLLYTISGNDSLSFEIDAQSGMLRLLPMVGLDYERQVLYQFAVIATDSKGRTAEANVTIEVENENDNEPRFTEVSFNFTVPENSLPGVFVGEVAAVDADGDRIRFSLIQGAEDQFVLDPDTGFVNVSSNANLDREAKFVYVLRVSVTDQFFTTEGTVYIHLSDVNDSPPFYSEPVVSLVVPEDQPLMEPFYLVEAQDPDVDSSLVYFIEAFSVLDANFENITKTTNIFSWFMLNATTGKLHLMTPVDRESISSVVLHILAMDVNGESGSDNSVPSLKLRIEIGDVNDNPPEFQPSNTSVLVFQVQEESGVNTIIATLAATDPDQGEAGEVQFFVRDEDKEGLPFSISPETGNVRIESLIDREQTNWVNFTAVAVDGGEPPLNATIPVAVLITDINDNNPSFAEQLYIFMVNESSVPGTLVATVTALDPDEGDFGTVRYTLSGADGVFTIDAHSGEITLTAPIDRETVNQYLLTVFARDNPEGSSNNKRETSVMVVIEVEDVNEFSPQPSMPIFEFDVPEGTLPGSEVGRIEATDPDNPNQVFAFTVVDSVPSDWDSLFLLDRTTGTVLLTADIYNSSSTFSPFYMLVVQISDGGTPEHLTTVEVIISINSFNMNPPVFDQPILNVSIPEDFITGLPVAVVRAIDPDREDEITYKIQDQMESLFIISGDGEIRFLGSLDHDRRPSYTILVTAQDPDGLTANATVNILVTDVNDNPPVFTQEQYEFEILENEPQGTVIGAVMSTDADSAPDNRDTVYRILSGADDLVTIDEVTGNITVNRPINRELIERLSLKIEAENTRPPTGVELKSRTDVIITIIDVNDNPPVFEDSVYEASLLETTPPGSFILEVAASDADADDVKNANFTFTITEGDGPGFFTIDSTTGSLYVSKSLANQPDLIMQSVRLTVAATDQGTPPMMSTVVVIINITDANDNQPVFVVPQPGQSLELPENQPPPYFIAQVEAHDVDLGLNGEVRYGLLAQGIDSQLFTIDPVTGELSANFTADREQKAVYTIVLQATDRGDNPVPTSMEVAVMIADENDNEPVFPISSDGVQEMSVPENAKTSTEVGQITPAEDVDSGENAAINYFIVDGNSGGLFDLDPMTGIITVAKNIDRETAASHRLIIKASNDPTEITAEPSPNAKVVFNVLEDRSLKAVDITIQDINDNGPVFASDLFTVGISLFAERSSDVTQIEAVDPDTFDNTTRYSIKQTVFTRGGESQTELNLFSIGKETGIISNLRLFEQIHSEGFFDVTVEAVDAETNQTDQAVVRIYVIDMNQQIVLVIDSPMEEVKAKSETLAELLSEMTGGEVIIDTDSISILDVEGGGTDSTRSMVTFYVIDPDTNLVLDADTVIKKLDESPISVQELFVNEDIRDIYPLLGTVEYSFSTLGISLLAIALLILFGNTLFIIILCCLRWSPDSEERERYLRMLTGGLQSGVLYSKGSIRTDLNATEFSSLAGSNPAFDFDGSLGDWPASRSDIAGREAVETTNQFLSSEIASSAPGDIILKRFVSEKALKGDYLNGHRYGSRGSPPGSGRNMLGSLNSLRSEGSGASANTPYDYRGNGWRGNSPPGGKKPNRGSISTAQAAQSFADFHRNHSSDRRGSLIKIDEDEDTFTPREDVRKEKGDATAEIRRILQELTDDGKPSPSGISYDSSSSLAAMEAYRDQLEYDNELTPITEYDEDASTFSSRRGSEKVVDPLEITLEIDPDEMTEGNGNKHSKDRHNNQNRHLAIKTSPSKKIYVEDDDNLKELYKSGTRAQEKRKLKKYRATEESEAPGHAAILRQSGDDRSDDSSHPSLSQTASNASEDDNRRIKDRVLIEDRSDDDGSSSDGSEFELEEIPGLNNNPSQTGKKSGFYQVQTNF